MKRLSILLVGLMLTGCGSTNPFDTGDSNDTISSTISSTIPETLKNDLSGFSYDPATQTLTVTGITLDEVPFTADYRRRAGMDVPGYQAYTAQDDPLDRHSTAFVIQSGNSGSVRAGVVVTGGAFNRFFGGGYYERDGGFTPPTVSNTSGLVTYAGTYAGLTNVGGDGGDLLPVPVGTDPSIIPTDAAEITGNILLNVDFADNSLEGSIYNRRLVDAGAALPTVVLIATSIAANGTFFGERVEYDGIVTTDIGDYGGIFGGPNAESVGGVVQLTEWDGDTNLLGLETEQEYGVFVLNQCGTPDENPAICPIVNP